MWAALGWVGLWSSSLSFRGLLIRPLMEWGLLWYHHVLFLLFLFLVLVQSQKSQHSTFSLSHREGPFTFVCKSSCQDWQDWYISCTVVFSSFRSPSHFFLPKEFLSGFILWILCQIYPDNRICVTKWPLGNWMDHALNWTNCISCPWQELLF